MVKRLWGAAWRKRRQEVWERDCGKCVKCDEEVSLRSCHVDHIIPLSKGGTNKLENLRTLCPKHHVLREDMAHRGMTARALAKGWIPPSWRELVW